MTSSIMSNHGSKSMMGASVNMAITIFGFVLSALFIVVICCRLLCSRFRHRGPQSSSLDNAFDRRRASMSSIERSLQGLEPSIVSRFPTIKYNRQLFTSSNDNVCTICLADYKERELLRVLPNCAHTFHVACIDTWLRQHYTCPICRISLRIICEWRSTSGPFISVLAKPRFVQGALPEYLFEQTSIDKVEMGESSSSQGFHNSLEVGDCNLISANVRQPSSI